MRDWNNFFTAEDFDADNWIDGNHITREMWKRIADRANALIREEVGKALVVGHECQPGHSWCFHSIGGGMRGAQ